MKWYCWEEQQPLADCSSAHLVHRPHPRSRSLHHSIPSHSLSLLLATFSASAWKIAVVCNDILPTCFFSSFLASSSHSQALSPQSLVFRSQSRKESGPCFYFITCDTPGHKRKPLSLLLFYSTLSPLNSRQTEPGHALHVALQIMISLKSLFSSFPRPIHFPCSCALPPSHCLSLSRCFSHPALLHSQSLKIKEIKHRYRVLACKVPWCRGESISLLYFINPISLSLLLAPFSASAWKIDVVCNDVLLCLPPASVYSLTPPPTHQPLTSISCFSVDHLKATEENRFHNLYSTPVTWITR